MLVDWIVVVERSGWMAANEPMAVMDETSP